MAEWEGRAAAMRKLFPNAPMRITCRMCELVRESTLHTTGQIGSCPCMIGHTGSKRTRRRPKQQPMKQSTPTPVPVHEREAQRIVDGINADLDREAATAASVPTSRRTLVLADFATYRGDA